MIYAVDDSRGLLGEFVERLVNALHALELFSHVNQTHRVFLLDFVVVRVKLRRKLVFGWQ